MNKQSRATILSVTTLILISVCTSIMKYKLVTNNDSKNPFKYHTVLISLQSFVCFMFFSVNKRLTSKNVFIDKNIKQRISLISGLSLLTSKISYYAFSHFMYPSLMLGTAYKITPFFLINFLIYKKKIKSTKFISLGLTAIGIITFIIFGTCNFQEKISSAKGLSILILNSLIENYIQILERRIKEEYINDQSYIQLFHLFVSLFAMCFVIIFTDELSDSIIHLVLKRKTLYILLVFLLSYGLEELILCKLTEKFGVYCAKYAKILRNIIYILVPFVVFGVNLTLTQWLSLFTVLSAFAVDFMDRKSFKVFV